MYRRIRNLFVGFAIVVTYLMVIAASAPTGDSQATALAIAGVVGALLPFVLKLVPKDGFWILGITLGASIVIAVVAQVVSGELVLTDLQHASALTLFTDFMAAWGLSQFMYATLTQSPKTASAVT